MRFGKPGPYAPVKDFDDWDFTFIGYAGTLDPAYPALLKAARPPHEQQSHTEWSAESREESWKQVFRSLQTTLPDRWNVRSGRQHGTVRANHDIQVRFQD